MRWISRADRARLAKSSCIIGRDDAVAEYGMFSQSINTGYTAEERGLLSAYLNGARLGTPSADTDETSAMGRGTTAEVSSMYSALNPFIVNDALSLRKEGKPHTTYPSHPN